MLRRDCGVDRNSFSIFISNRHLFYLSSNKCQCVGNVCVDERVFIIFFLQLVFFIPLLPTIMLHRYHYAHTYPFKSARIFILIFFSSFSSFTKSLRFFRKCACVCVTLHSFIVGAGDGAWFLLHRPNIHLSITVRRIQRIFVIIDVTSTTQKKAHQYVCCEWKRKAPDKIMSWHNTLHTPEPKMKY